MSFLYWIKLPEHTDITTQGYVGITSKTVAYRFAKHLRYSHNPKTKKYTINNAFIKYADKILVETVLEGSHEYCLLMEQKLRPLVNIGWNQAQGGALTKLGTVCSEETKRKIGLASKGRTMSEENKLKMSIRSKGRKMSDFNKSQLTKALKGVPKTSEARAKMSAYKKEHPTLKKMWEHSGASAVWLDCVELYSEYSQGTTAKVLMVSRNLTHSVVYKMFARFRDGWNPNEDQEYLSWLEEKKGIE